ncbi:triose-phosphate isomerase [Candidatus Williamhamiltonella defendens]|uniref:Triosephosphate isomerase n=1 Tax=Candidatus Hamiltonella defensa (Bemisia tabaci) TaxID=672795 RepID=A0A249DZ93_9ENTR|nr:triose-phosphate isomerase [Candidatus Hamiltonella defensa]ASX26227.1 triose-phosphate isomerase [Candidatus Hamiltonella defensa (Bemisia tabaci)]CED79282.1 Triosephosphate isomerase [Candidatus Hamiltonella defensa (Bemisia tabaci)]
MRRSLIMGNWKLNGSLSMLAEFITSLSDQIDALKMCDIAIAPPAVYLHDAKKQLKNDRISLAAQNVDFNTGGAFTGELSPQMLKEVGAKYVIIGHSERRSYHQETNEGIAKKFALLKETGLIPVLCIGESETENAQGLTQTICAKQLDAILEKCGPDAFKNSVIAYEPIWAIGTGKAATASEAQKVHAFIRQHVSKGKDEIAETVIIQYGGSVNASNADEFFAEKDIDGALVGGASLKVNDFLKIAQSAVAAKTF